MPLSSSPKLEGGRWLTGDQKPLEVEGQPLVTIVTVVYNGALHLEDALTSVLNQTYPNIEYLIIDGGSTDGTLDIIRKYEKRIDYWVSEPDKGIYDAMNKGVALARGRYIGFKNADDWYLPDAVSMVARHFGNSPALVYGNTWKVWQQEPLQTSLLVSDHRFLPQRSCVDHRGAFFRSDLHKARPYDLRYRLAADYDLLLEWYMQGRGFVHCQQVLGCMRPGGASHTTAIYRQLLNIQKKYNYWRAVFRFGLNHLQYHRLTTQNKILQFFLGEAGFRQFKSRKTG